MALEDLTYRDYWNILRRRWKLAAAGALLGGAAGLALAKVQTPLPTYEASAVVRYDPHGGYEVARQAPEPGNYIAPQILFIRSSVVIGNVAKRLKLIPEDTPRDGYDAHAQTLASLLTRIDVVSDPRGRSGVMLIRARARTPEEAASFANEVVAAYREENIFEIKKDIVKRREFIDRKLGENEAQLNKAQLEYEHFRREHPQAAIEPGMQGVISNVAKSEALAQALAEKVRETRRQLVLVRSGRPPSDIGLQMIVGATGTARLQQLSGSYTKLNLQKARLLTELTEAHPLVLHSEEQLEAVRAEIEEELQLILDAFEKQQEEEAAKLEEIRDQEKNLPEEAMRLAQLARDVKVYENIQLQLRSQLEDALIKEGSVTGQVSVVSAASLPTAPVNRPNYVRLGGIGFVGGIFLGFVIAVLLESSRITLQTLREMEESLELPVLGIHPRVSHEQLAAWLPEGRSLRRDSPEWSRSLALATLLAPRSPLGESFRTLRANLQARAKEGPSAFTLTAAAPNEGVTTVLLNLAISFAQSGQRVLLVESDFRNPSISNLLGLSREPGLVNLLLGACAFEDAVRSVADFVTGALTLDEILLGPGMDHFHVMPCGDLSGHTGELLASGTFASVLESMRSRFDLVLFDSPALAVAADAVSLGAVTEIILVYDPYRTQRQDLATGLDQLRKGGCTAIGLVVNGMEPEALVAAEPDAEPASVAAS